MHLQSNVSFTEGNPVALGSRDSTTEGPYIHFIVAELVDDVVGETLQSVPEWTIAM